MRTPASSIAREDDAERKLDIAVQAVGATLADLRGERPRETPRRFGVTHERSRLLLGGRVGLELDAVFGHEIVELVLGAARIDQIREDHRVVGGRLSQPQRFRVVRDDVEARRSRQRRRCEDHLSRSGCHGDALRVGRDADAAAELPQVAFTPGHGLRLGLGTLRCRQRLVERVDAPEQRAKLEPPEDLLELGAVRRLQDELGRIDAEVEIAPHRRQELRGPRLLGVLGDCLRPRGRELRSVLDDVLERAVLRDQLPRRLVPDAGDARDVVARVALQADEVRNLERTNAVPRLDALGRVDLHVRDAARRHHQADVLGDELERVAIGRDDAGLDVCLVGERREGRDHVVGLPPLELEVLVAERLDDRPEVRELLAQEIRHRPPLGLVLGVDLLAVDGPRVPGHGDTAWPVVREQLEEHVGESEERVRRLPVGRLQLLREREEPAIGEVVAVDEEELRVAHGTVVEDELLPGQRFRAHDAKLSSASRGVASRSSRARGSSPSRSAPTT